MCIQNPLSDATGCVFEKHFVCGEAIPSHTVSQTHLNIFHTLPLQQFVTEVMEAADLLCSIKQ